LHAASAVDRRTPKGLPAAIVGRRDPWANRAPSASDV
jgi:hypothetical protein